MVTTRNGNTREQNPRVMVIKLTHIRISLPESTWILVETEIRNIIHTEQRAEHPSSGAN
jgi:hypothetical protein